MGQPKGLNLIKHNNQILAKLYNTVIVDAQYSSLDKAWTIRLNSGGWRTKHTKKCINLSLQSLNVYLYQKKFNWYVKIGEDIHHEFNDNMLYKIYD